MLKNSVPRSLALSFVLSLPTLLVGCADEFVDDDFGGVDLLEFFYDTGVNQRPPDNYSAQPGWLNSEAAFYYDFGKVAVNSGRPGADLQIELQIPPWQLVPTTAPVNPMYFFFDSRGQPMFSVPMKEKRTGRFSMPGGLQVRNVNPVDDASRDVAYPIRPRDLHVDTKRNVADYQSPVIDQIFDLDTVTPDQRKYSGIWEFVKVKAPAGYVPDSIKWWRTLDEAWNLGSGDFEIVQTGNLINCPLIDSRSVVVPRIAAYGAGELRPPQPIIEVWYRRKKAQCFLVNGWETIGETVRDKAGNNGLGNDTYELYNWDQDSKRVSVMDVEIETQGVGKARQQQAVAPLGRLFIPVVGKNTEQSTAIDAYIRQFMTFGALPRRKQDDPRGYRPIRWWWDIQVLDLPEIGRHYYDHTIYGSGYEFQRGQSVPPINDLDNVDSSRLQPRPGAYVRNFPLAGKQISCVSVNLETDPADDPCLPLGMVCGWYQEEDRDIFCQLPKVKFGAFCAATLTECWDRIDKPRFMPDAECNVKIPKNGDCPAGHDAIKENTLCCPNGTAGTKNEKYYLERNKGDTVMNWFFEGGQVDGCPDETKPACKRKKDGTPHRDFVERFNAAQIPMDVLAERVELDKQGTTWTAWLKGGGRDRLFKCHGEDGIGHCMMSCNGQEANVLQGATTPIELEIDGAKSKVDVPLDSRCGGERMPGYRCLPITNDRTDKGDSNRTGACLRDCTLADARPKTDALCSYKTPMWLSDEQSGPGGYDIAKDTKCLSVDGFDACVKDLAFEPR